MDGFEALLEGPDVNGLARAVPRESGVLACTNRAGPRVRCASKLHCAVPALKKVDGRATVFLKQQVCFVGWIKCLQTFCEFIARCQAIVQRGAWAAAWCIDHRELPTPCSARLQMRKDCRSCPYRSSVISQACAAVVFVFVVVIFTMKKKSAKAQK